MIRRFAYLGIALVVVAVVIILASGYVFKSGVSKSITNISLTINPGSYSPVLIMSHNTTALAIYAVMQNSTNLYILNSSTYMAWSSYMNSHSNASGLGYVKGLKVNSTDMFINKSFVIAPVLLPVNRTDNATTSRIYVVVDNTHGSASSASSFNAIVSYVPIQSSGLVVYEVADLAAFLLGVSGIIVLLYGIFKKGKPKEEMQMAASGMSKDQAEKDYVDRLYKGKAAKSRSKKGS